MMCSIWGESVRQFIRVYGHLCRILKMNINKKLLLKTENEENTMNACTVKLTYNDHGYNELMVIANNLVWF